MKRYYFVLVLLAALSSSAATRNWTNSLGGDWSVAANWSPNGVPAAIDIANITNNGTYTVTILSNAVTVASLNLGGASGTQTVLVGKAVQVIMTTGGIVQPNGVLTLTNGGLEGNLTVQAGGQLQFTNSAVKNVYALTLINQGTVHWSGGNLYGGNTPSTVISNGGLWEITGDNQIHQYYSGAPLYWTNSGTLLKSGGSGISYINNFNFINTASGIVSVTSGTLQFSGDTGSVLGGTLSATSPGLMSIASGTWTDAGGSAIGTGTSRFHGGTLNLRTNIIPGLKLTGGNVLVTGTTTFQQAGAITNLTLDGSQLQGTSCVGNGTVVVNSGGLEGNLTVQAGGQLQFTNSAVKNVYALTLINQGTVHWSGGNLYGGNTPSTVISNGGLWEITGDNQIHQYYSGAPLYWTNSGTLLKSGGSGISYINNFNFINTASGIVSVTSGTLQFSGDTGSVLGGTLSATSPGLMSIASGTWTDAGGSAIGTGTSRFHGGTLNLRTNIIPGLKLTGGNVLVTGTTTFQQAGAITNLTLDGSQLQGTSRVGNGTVVVNSGGLEGNLTVQAGGQLQFTNSAVKNVYALTLINQGTVHWSGGNLYGGNTPSTVISNGGLWEITGDNQIHQYYSGAPLYWTNSGTLLKSGGSGISYINNFNFINTASGIVSVTSGTLQFSGDTGSVLGGTLSATSPGLMSIASGTWTDAGGSAIGTGTSRFHGGTLNLRTNIIPGLKLTGGNVLVTGTTTFQQAGAITNLTLDGSQLQGTSCVGNGTVVVNSGGLEGNLTVQAGGQLQFTNSAVKNVYALTLINQGTVHWSGGNLYGGNTPSTVISNGGLWEITGDNQIHQYYSGAPLYWTNSGTLLKSGGSGISYINNFNFINLSSGLIQVDTGTLQLPAGFENSAGTLRLNGGKLQAGGTFGMAGGTLEGSGLLGANLLTGGVLTPGTNGPGLINFPSSLNLRLGAILTLSGTNTSPGAYDQLSVVGTVALSNATLQVTSLPSVSVGTTFVLITNDASDAVLGTFNGLAENAQLLVSGQPFRIHYAGGSGNDVTLVRDSGVVVVGPTFSTVTYSNGFFRLIGAGGASAVYTIQASTNFINWTNIGTATSDGSGIFNFTDSNAFQFSYRFYRTTN